MIDWLILLPDNPELAAYRADLRAKVAIGSETTFAELTPLQLATKLGDHDMFRFLLQKQAKLDWT